MNQAPIIKGSTATLTMQARDVFHGIGIHVKRTKGIKVAVTQHCVTGTSFHFLAGNTAHEYHVPGRLVSQCFVESPGLRY